MRLKISLLQGKKILAISQTTLKLNERLNATLEIIGEAVNRIIKKQPDFNLSNARKIVDTRNLIIHGYDSVTDEIIWSIIINHLPILKSEVSNYLN